MIKAKELFYNMLEKDEQTTSTEMMIEFAKLHVQEALKQASKKVVLEFADDREKLPDYVEDPFNATMNEIGDFHYIYRDSILNAYDLNNIK